ncbi:MAG: TrbI/VirB10 family protein [Pseudomonadota bacterium]
MPIVTRPNSGLSMLTIGICAAIAAIALFTFLNARRQEAQAPSVKVRRADMLGGPVAPPALMVPPEYAPPAEMLPVEAPPPVTVVRPPPPFPQPQPQPQIIYVPQLPPVSAQLAAPPRVSSGPILVIDNGRTLSAGSSDAPGSASGATPQARTPGADALPRSSDRARAGMFANQATTVAQGTLIHAILETAFDSSRPGFARAIVSRDVRSFDGSQVLIPRGSRLVGEYGTDVSPGQKRALINWTRLTRPDGATISIGSPATDPLGRGGVRAKVDSHFFERFSGAILQSVLDIGVSAASARLSRNTVVVALPGTLNSVTQTAQPQQIPPSLSVKQGSSISIFVARDLDFTSLERRR